MSRVILTGRVYDHKRIRERVPKALLVSVQRRPWRYTPSDITRMPDLGPPESLLEHVLENQDCEGQEFVDLQAYYSVEYFKHLTNEVVPLSKLQQLIEPHDVIVLLCREKSGEFCHRHFLRYFLVDILNLIDGGEIEVKKE